MLNEFTAEILVLSRDVRFVRNLSLTFILAIACLLSLSDLQRNNTKASDRATVTNMSQSHTKIIVDHK